MTDIDYPPIRRPRTKKIASPPKEIRIALATGDVITCGCGAWHTVVRRPSYHRKRGWSSYQGVLLLWVECHGQDRLVGARGLALRGIVKVEAAS